VPRNRAATLLYGTRRASVQEGRPSFLKKEAKNFCPFAAASFCSTGHPDVAEVTEFLSFKKKLGTVQNG
jgi:hypothetical protein